jgi:hypothetical protein
LNLTTNLYCSISNLRSRLAGLLVIWLFAVAGLFGQTGPGGVGNSTSNILWLRADLITELVETDRVQNWYDVSGNGNNVSQITPTNRPRFYTNIINGFPVVDFASGGNHFLTGSLGATLNSPFTILAVTRFRNTTEHSYLLNIGNSLANTNVSISRDFRVGWNSYYCWTGGGANYYDAPANAMPAGVDWLINSIHTATGGHNLYLNGTSQTVTPSGSPGILNPTATLILGRKPDGTNRMNGYSPEIIVFNRLLNSAERKIAENYLAAKYGLSIPHDYFSYESVYKYDVAGIGQDDASNLNSTAMSSGILQVGSATSLGNGEYLLFGHDNGTLGSWSSSGTPSEIILRLQRNWRFDETGDVGTITVLIDYSKLPAAPAACSNRYILVDSDGDFSAGATVHELTLVSGNRYSASGVSIAAGDYITVGIGAMPDADAGSDGSTCGSLSYTLAAVPSVGTGVWTSSGPGTASWSSINSPTATVTVSVYGEYTFRWTETAGNCSDFDEITIDFVEDVTSPVITCPVDVTINCQDDSTPAGTGSATATDNCAAVGNITISYTDVSTQNADASVAGHYNYTITRTWRATDPSGNFSECVQIITVQDVTDPVITCPVDVTINCQDDSTPAGTGSATATDNCAAVGNITISYTDVSTQNADASVAGHYNYTITRTWRATDPSGNFSECVQIITVQDVTDPVITCPVDVTINCQDDSTPAGTGSATATDNCAAVGNITISYTDVSTQNADASVAGHYNYTITRTWRATDPSGNFSECVQIITVQTLLIRLLPVQWMLRSTVRMIAPRPAQGVQRLLTTVQQLVTSLSATLMYRLRMPMLQ